MDKQKLETLAIAIIFGALGLALLATIPGWLDTSFIYNLLFPILLLTTGLHLLFNARRPTGQVKLGSGLAILGGLTLLVQLNWLSGQAVTWLLGVALVILSVFMLAPYLRPTSPLPSSDPGSDLPPHT